jgi:hypothetical protein
MFQAKALAAFDPVFLEENVFPPSEAERARAHSFLLVPVKFV